MERSEGRKLKVFISYSRRDSSALASELAAGLGLLGFEAFLDRHDIAAGEDWEARLAKLIQAADTVVFIVSPESVTSERCAWEVDKTAKLSKRLIPVVGIAVPDDRVPAALTRLNYIFFTEGQSFTGALGQLSDALRIDLDWIREHTRLGELSARWVERKRPEALLLRGDELAAAQAWMARRVPDAPEIPDGHRSFIVASADAEAIRVNREREQLEEFARAQSARAEALAARESAVKQLSRRTTLGLVSAGGLTLAAGGLAYWAMQAEERFRQQRQRADEALKTSVEEAIRLEATRTDIEGQMTAYASSFGQFAEDGPKGGNSPYTTRVLRELADDKSSLNDALMRAHSSVLKNSNGAQRPFLSSDVNGHIFLRRNLAGQRRIALIISEEKLTWEGGVLDNVRRDALAWRQFLERQAGFETIVLENPDQAAWMDGFRRVQLALTRHAGRLHPPVQRVGLSVQTHAPEVVPQNTLVLFFYSGVGAYQRGVNYLMAHDTKLESRADLQNVTESMVSLTAIQGMLRKAAAASVLILDTNFNDPDKV